MEDQTTWKGHTFTLLVFTGIVVLCSIFFILGMLVGHAQGQKTAAAAAPEESLTADAKPELKEDKPDFTFYDAVKKEPPAVLEHEPPKPDPPVISPPRVKSNVADPPVTSKPSNVVNYQIGAVRKSADAEKLLSAAKQKGFRAFILAPARTDKNPFYRIQVGPFADPVEAQDVKERLERAGYQPILKK
jgi:cell division septation protein DedD